MSFTSIPDRQDGTVPTEDWFNSLKQAGSTLEGAIATSVTNVTTDVTLSTSGYYFVDSSGLGSGVDLTITLPASDSSLEFKIKVVALNDATIIIDANASETIDGSLTKVLEFQNEAITLKSNGSNWFIV